MGQIVPREKEGTLFASATFIAGFDSLFYDRAVTMLPDFMTDIMTEQTKTRQNVVLFEGILSEVYIDFMSR